jgi:tetratricopeptide (TPR) repeat protein
LLYWLVARLTEARWKALFVAALFALHPLHVESVAWVAERKDLLSTLFMLLTMLCYRQYVHARTANWLVLSVFLYALGLMAKPMLVTLPLLLLLLDYWPLQRYGRLTDLKGLLAEKWPYFLLMSLSCVVTYYAQHRGAAVAAVDAVPLLLRVQNAFNSYLTYLAKMIWPQGLAIIYPLPEQIPVTTTLLSATLLTAISSMAVWYAAVRKYLLVGWAWYLVTLVPVIGLVQVGPQAMADRYTYIPLIGLFIVLSWGWADIAASCNIGRTVTTALAIVILSVLLLLTWRQVGHWRNTTTLFSHAVATVPDNYVALRILGVDYAKRGNLEAAIDCFREAVRIVPKDAKVHTDLGVALLQRREVEEAMHHFAEAIRYNPRDANAHFNYGVALASINRYQAAVFHYASALQLDPQRNDARANLGAAFYHLGRIDEALVNLREALRIEPDNESIKSFLLTAQQSKQVNFQNR